MRRLLVLAALAAVPSSPPAQADEVLTLQRGEDRRDRDLLYRVLHGIRVDVQLEDASLQELATFLAAASGNVTNFAAWTKEEVEPLTLRLRRTRLTTVLDIAQRFGKIRFVFRKGIVLIQHQDEVKPWTSLRIYNVRATTTPLPSFPGPELELKAPGDEDVPVGDEDGEGTTASGFTADRLVDLIRTHVLPESWDTDGVSISELRGVLWVRQTETGHRKVEELLRALGAIPPPVRQRPAPPPARVEPAREPRAGASRGR